MTEFRSDGKPLALDPDAVSADRNMPPFVARPQGAPVYYGFRILEDVSVEGFRLGIITAIEEEPAESGDAFVVAPDDSRAGLVWETGEYPLIQEICPPKPVRWGVWGVFFPHPMISNENARKNLAFILPELRKRWEQWKQPNHFEQEP